MRTRIIVGSIVVLACLSFGAAVSRSAADPSRKWAIVNLVDTTMISGAFVSGPVIFVHDDARMARGEPCTSVHRFDPDKGPGQEIVAFHCKPRWTKPPVRFTTATTARPDGLRILTEYQFAGDEEAHGVPTKAR